MFIDIAAKWFLKQVQRTWDSFVNDPKSTMAGFGYAGIVVGVMEYAQHQLGCNLHQLDLVALWNVWQGSRARDTQRTAGDEENARLSSVS